jgi:hypothetical protein
MTLPHHERRPLEMSGGDVVAVRASRLRWYLDSESTNIGAVEQASPFPALKLLRILKHAQKGGDTLGRGSWHEARLSNEPPRRQDAWARVHFNWRLATDTLAGQLYRAAGRIWKFLLRILS